MADLPADPLVAERRRLLAALELERARGCPERRPSRQPLTSTSAAAAALDAELAPLRRAALHAATRLRRAT